MAFPIYLQLGDLRIHPHPLWEGLGYFVAFRLSRQRFRHSTVPWAERGVIIAGGLIGGVLGAKALAILQNVNLWGTVPWYMFVMGGKTIVGALLGATWGVEVSKKIVGVEVSTGDAFAYPLLVGTAIGRVGCFLTGLSDDTGGLPTSWPWGVDFGDGIPRHPTQLYEILFLVLLGLWLRRRARLPMEAGDLFRFYSIGYLAFRWAIDFIKPGFHIVLGMTAIQLACIFGLLYYQKAWKRLI
jgi:phosphatidylglycerol---prolipoprotein diacylglyceryl transferase